MIHRKITVYAALLVFLYLLGSSNSLTCQAQKEAKLLPTAKLSREEQILMNLNRGPNSTGFYLGQTLRQVKSISHDLHRALRQLEQADIAYAKSRGRPDDRFLASPASQIKQAKQAADELEVKLRDAYQDLKVSVAQTLAFE